MHAKQQITFLDTKIYINKQVYNQNQTKFDRYFIDFVFPLKKIAIEVDGKRWHNPESEKEIVRENKIKEEFNLIRLDASKVIKKYYHDTLKSILSSEAEQ